MGPRDKNGIKCDQESTRVEELLCFLYLGTSQVFCHHEDKYGTAASICRRNVRRLCLLGGGEKVIGLGLVGVSDPATTSRSWLSADRSAPDGSVRTLSEGLEAEIVVGLRSRRNRLHRAAVNDTLAFEKRSQQPPVWGRVTAGEDSGCLA